MFSLMYFFIIVYVLTLSLVVYDIFRHKNIIEVENITKKSLFSILAELIFLLLLSITLIYYLTT